jgi:hypothetical protein
MCFGKGSVEIAIGFRDHRRLGTASWREFARRRGQIDARRQRLDLRHDQLGDVFGTAGIGGEYSRYWLADIAHMAVCQYRLTISLQSRNGCHAKPNHGNIGDVFRSPHGNRVGTRQCLCGADSGQAAERDRRAYHPHVKHIRYRDIGGEAAPADQQRAVFEALNRSADKAHLPISAAAASTDFRMF